MKVVLAVIGKQGRLDPEVLRLVPSLAARAPPFAHMPYRAVTWATAGGRVALFAWDNDVHAAPPAPLIQVDGQQAVAVAGYLRACFKTAWRGVGWHCSH